MRKIKTRWLLTLILAVAGLLAVIIVNTIDPFTDQVATFQDTFQRKEKALNEFLSQKQKDPLSFSDDDKKSGFYYHCYKNDSLILWNSNDLPISRFADLHFPSNGVIHLQNGWYFARSLKSGEKTISAAFLIKKDYPYENSDLRNVFHKDFRVNKNTTISLDQNEGIEIRDSNGHYLFSLIESKFSDESAAFSQWMLLLYLSVFALWLGLFITLFKRMNSKWRWVVPLSLLLFKIFSLHFGLIHFSIGTGALDPALYGTNKWFPNFFEFVTNVLVISTIFYMIELFLRKIVLKGKLAFLPLIFSIFYWIIIRDLSEGLVENSSIPLSIDRLFSLNGYTILAVFSIGLLLYIQFRLTQTALLKWIEAQLSVRLAFITALITWVAMTLWISYFEQESAIPELFFAIFLLPVIYLGINRKGDPPLGLSVVILSTGTLCITVMLMMFNVRREQTVQEFYAQKLATEQNIETELEYPKIAEKIRVDPVLTRIKKGDDISLSSSEFEDGLERRIFNGFWERYELDFFLFDSTGNALMSEGEDLEEDRYEKLNDIIEKHGQVSTIDTHVYFISDHTDQYSYVIRQKLASNSNEERVLIVTLRSKKIPEEIGFPRLLISGNAEAFQYLEDYSIAKYHNKRLVVNYGPFNYPFRQNAINSWRKLHGNYHTRDGYTHYILTTDAEDVIVLSSSELGVLSYISSFSYLFLFFGCFFIPRLFRFRQLPVLKRSLSLAVRIQVILIGIVLVSLIAFGWGSGAFVRGQYESFSSDMISDKLRSMNLEVGSKIRYRDVLTLEKHGNTMEAFLEKVARIYRTDANFYDVHGFLIASSRPKIYKLGLIGDQMNRKAFLALYKEKKSRYIQEEQIGELHYASAYVPSFNKRGKLLGYLNLQYFGQQRAMEEQIEHFLVAIINIFMLLLALSVITALLISNWLTAPLRLLKENVSRLKLGGLNEPIFYQKDDEIGALVTAYNAKLEELEITASQLAKSERESAWREMAKQVAHEIKNPLTPMKLSVQQLERSFDPNDPQNALKIKKVTTSLVEQIDTLTRIANEFSQFAQMPLPVETSVELNELIQNVIHVFQETSNKGIKYQQTAQKVYIQADKDQMIRVFNNLIKNAIQAASADREFELTIRTDVLEQEVHITIEDNGQGIPLEEQKMIFVPHFTTKTSGSGLGLAMVRQIIENHHGSITFSSEVNKGTRFKIILPKI